MAEGCNGSSYTIRLHFTRTEPYGTGAFFVLKNFGNKNAIVVFCGFGKLLGI